MDSKKVEQETRGYFLSLSGKNQLRRNQGFFCCVFKMETPSKEYYFFPLYLEKNLNLDRKYYKESTIISIKLALPNVTGMMSLPSLSWALLTRLHISTIVTVGLFQ